MATFRGVEKDEANQFYRQIGAAEPKDLDKIMQDHISRKQRHRQRDSNLGKYLPLGVYEKQGFDIKRIEDEITDTMDLPGLGKCYRVPIPESGDIMDRDNIRSQELSGPNARIRDNLAATADPPPRSQSRRQPNRNNTPAETDEERLARVKSEEVGRKLAAKAEVMMLRKVKGEAAKIVAKVATTLLDGDKLFKDTSLKHLPSWSIENAKATFASIKEAKKEAEHVLGGSATTMTATSASVTDLVKQFYVQKQFLESMMQHAPSGKPPKSKHWLRFVLDDVRG